MDLQLTHYNIFPPAAEEAYVNQTAPVYSSYYPWGTIGPDPGGMNYTWNAYLSQVGGVKEMKFNIDMGEPITPDRLRLRNQNNGSASYADAGVKDFILYGSNARTAFDNTDYADLTDLTELGVFQAQMDIGNPLTDQYFNLPGTQAFQYYILRISSNWGNATFLGIRHLGFQLERAVPLTLNHTEFNFENFILSKGEFISRTDRNMIGGVIKVNGVPAKKRIVVFNRRTHVVEASTWSNKDTGVWRIAYINEFPERELIVLAFDDTGEFNAEVFDFVSQVTPPVIP